MAFAPNSEQQSWMDYLARLQPAKKCKCGWQRKHECMCRECVRADGYKLLDGTLVFDPEKL